MVTVTVTSPQTEREGKRDQFTSYLVTAGNTSVRRRYSDFQWLYARLQSEMPGAVVPILPHRRALVNSVKFDPDFVEQRRRHLQHFMDQVIAHEELARAPSMTPFMLDAMGTEFQTGQKNIEMKHPSTVSDTPIDDDEYFSRAGAKTAVKKVSGFLAKAGTLIRVRTGQKELLQTPQEKEIERLQARITAMEGHVKILRQSAKAMTQFTSQMAATVGDMTSPLAEWKGSYQDYVHQEDETSELLQTFVEFTNDYSQLMVHKHREEQRSFEDAMTYLANDIRSFAAALQQRKQIQVAYTTTCQQITTKEEQIAKATQSLKPPEVTGKLSLERTELKALSDRQRATLEQATERLLKDSEENEKRLEYQLQQAFAQYAKVQISYTNRINEAWGQLLPYVDEEHRQGLSEDGTKPPMPPSEPPPPVPTD
eukprot:Nitzschia sp. Nitz4//scaffold116_size91068//55033//56307//NITZ4_004960-RA/size91068-processed-gene-0.44-mRNA-1//-1//CDS//3329533584//484//frame0